MTDDAARRHVDRPTVTATTRALPTLSGGQERVAFALGIFVVLFGVLLYGAHWIDLTALIVLSVIGGLFAIPRRILAFGERIVIRFRA